MEEIVIAPLEILAGITGTVGGAPQESRALLLLLPSDLALEGRSL